MGENRKKITEKPNRMKTLDFVVARKIVHLFLIRFQYLDNKPRKNDLTFLSTEYGQIKKLSSNLNY